MAKAKDKEVAASDVPTNVEVEETTDIDVNAESDPLESVDMEEETTMVVDESEEGDQEEETEDDGKVEYVGTDVPEDEKMEEEDEVEEVKTTEDIEADGKGEKDINADEKGEKDINADEKGEKPTEDINADKKGESASNKKVNKIGKRKKKAVVKAAASIEKTNEAAAEKKEAVAEKEVLNEKQVLNEKLMDTDQPGASAAEKKNTKKADGMGLIFMCNAKTKKDCFNYKVLGLPASKKGLVEKVYKGMRLFLFDIDLKLMYGIYKAASPGGYNLEPKAFKSAFPSQVRFTVLKDCLPLPEEKFKVAIKGNYFGRNKFNCELSAEQVRNLCKLFRSGGKASFSKKPREAIRAETRPTRSDREPRRRSQHERAREDHRGREMVHMDRRERPREERRGRERDVRRERSREDRRGRERPDRRGRSREDYRGRERQDHRGRSREDRVTQRIRGRDLYSRRETYPSPTPRAVAFPPPLPPPSYAYERLADDYHYRIDPFPSLELRRDPLPSLELRRDPLPSIELRDPRVMDVDVRPREPVEYRDPYALYRDPLQYREAGYPLSSLPPSAYAPLYPRY